MLLWNESFWQKKKKKTLFDSRRSDYQQCAKVKSERILTPIWSFFFFFHASHSDFDHFLCVQPSV